MMRVSMIMRHGMTAVLAGGLAFISTAAIAGGNASRGAVLFKQRCSVCHATTPRSTASVGPDLFGIVGRQIAAANFKYSAAFKSQKFVWTAADIDSFLAGPAKKIPGTRMFISISDPADRADIVAYLTTLRKPNSGEPDPARGGP